MTGVLVVAAGFAAIIATGSVAVLVNDALERWWAGRGAAPRFGGGGAPWAAAPVRRNPSRTATTAPRGTVVSVRRAVPGAQPGAVQLGAVQPGVTRPGAPTLRATTLGLTAPPRQGSR